MAHSIAKDPLFPMKHLQITELKNTKRVADEVQTADLMVIRNGETVGYFVNPQHYEALVDAASETEMRETEAFLRNYERRHGSLARLDAAFASSVQGEWASAEEEAKVFGD